MNRHTQSWQVFQQKNLICMKQWQLLLEKTWQPEIMLHHMLISTWKRTLKCKSISIENEGEYEETSKGKETSSSSAQNRQHKKRNRMYEDDSCCYPFLGSHKTKKNENEKIQKIYQKILEKNPKNNRSEKRMLECWKNDKIGWEGTKIQNIEIWHYIFHWWEPCW